MSEHAFWKTYEFIAVNARFLLQALFQAHADLRTETVMLGVNGCADYRGKPRIDQSLAAYDDKDALLARGARPRLFHKVQFARFTAASGIR